LPKTTRAKLHARFAEWLGAHGQTLVELDEILGYHLEQVFRYREELGTLDDAAIATGAQAAGYLAQAARRAFDRGDAAAAVHLLTRAADLATVSSDELELLADLGQASYETGDLTRAKDVLNG
jgi:hypothetical protein